jgi:peroxiredoxin
MAEAPETLEGWYALHDFRRFDWPRWKALCVDKRETAVQELAEFLHNAEQVTDAPEGSSAFYSILGHKADLLFLHLRPTLEHLGALERGLARTLFADFTTPCYSYLSVTELSLYEAYARGQTEDPEALRNQPFVQRRLKPTIPSPSKMPYICFYPMNKRRGESVNWYTQTMEERRRMMREHGATGRKYQGRVQQMITGSTGLDDWEWAITLWAVDPLAIKKLVYQMRFDEVSAKYAEFGEFLVGRRVLPEELGELLAK